MAHFATVLPNHIWMEVVDAGRDLVFDHDSKVEGGWIILGDRHGNGIQFDQEKLESYRARHRLPPALGDVGVATVCILCEGKPEEVGRE